MPVKTPEERYWEWLERWEESVGIHEGVEISVDIEAARRSFYEQMGWEGTEEQIMALHEHARERYELFPKLGITARTEEHWWGFQMVWRIRGRYASVEDVIKAVRGIEVPR